MDQNNQSYPISNQPMNPVNSEKKVGPIVATLIIVLVLIIAALYLFASKVKEPEIPADTNLTEVPEVTSQSTEVVDLQSDLDRATAGLDDENF